MSEHKYNDAYNKGYEEGKREAFSGYCMLCYDELSWYEQAKLMVEWGADIPKDIPNILDKIRAEIEQLTITKGGDDYVRKMAELFSLKMKVLQIIDKYKAESEG